MESILLYGQLIKRWNWNSLGNPGERRKPITNTDDWIIHDKMSSIINIFNGKSNFYCEKGASVEDIDKAEKTLGIQFANDYKEYLQQYGSVSCGGHELTGFSADDNLDVVSVTKKNLQHNPSIILPLYVIEETHIDGIVIWQAKSGEIFKSDYKAAPVKIYNSLSDYVSTFENSTDRTEG